MSVQLFDHMKRFVTLGSSEKELLEENLVVQSVRKKAFLLSPGQICAANYFVLKGCLRMYFVKDSGQEHTLQFALENWWLADFTSLESRKPSGFYIQAIEPAEVLVLTREKMEFLSARVPQLDRYLRSFLRCPSRPGMNSSTDGFPNSCSGSHNICWPIISDLRRKYLAR
jgi:CRP-like cAMP-binding protein